MTDFAPGRDFARSLDRDDPLRDFRDAFEFPPGTGDSDCVYVCGNSLGLMPKIARAYVEDVLNDWSSRAVEGHFTGDRPWIRYQRLACEGFAHLTGATDQEVVAMNTLSVNLHVLMAAFFRPAGRRRKIVIESTAFPSDYFAVCSQLRWHGLDPAECLIEWPPRDDELLHTDDLQAILADHGEEIALLLLPGVQYYSGQVLDMARCCELARSAGCRIGLDLAHAVGNVPLALHEWGPDFATWCTYKYLNGGPGAIAGAFVHRRHLDGDGSGQLTGWWGHDEATRFRMAHRFEPAPGAERLQLSNPPILALAPVVASLGVFLEAGLERLRAKSIRQVAYLEALLEAEFAGRIETITPAAARGCQLSLVVRDETIDPRGLFRTLEALRVIGDWREPNVIRVAPVPLYNSYEDVFELVERLGVAVEANAGA